MLDVFILIVLCMILLASVANLVLLIFLGIGIANQGEAIMERQDEDFEDLLGKFNSLDQEIRYRLPRRIYGANVDDENDLTLGPEDSRIPR
jgi:hypothetical protein